MKKFVSVFVCVMCVMLASVLRHVILFRADSAVEYSRRPDSAAAGELSCFMEEDEALREIA